MESSWVEGIKMHVARALRCDHQLAGRDMRIVVRPPIETVIKADRRPIIKTELLRRHRARRGSTMTRAPAGLGTGMANRSHPSTLLLLTTSPKFPSLTVRRPATFRKHQGLRSALSGTMTHMTHPRIGTRKPRCPTATNVVTEIVLYKLQEHK